MASQADQQIDRTIQNNLPQLSKYGVLTVRPGWEIAGHQLTGRRAIVATVHAKKAKADLSAGEVLPDQIAGTPVDVREARPYQRLRATDPLAAEISQAHSRPEDSEPHWPLERELPSGQLLTSANSRTQTRLRAQSKSQPAGAAALAVATQPKKPLLPYQPKGCPPLQQVQVTANVTAATSPDAGFATLINYLSGTQSSLVVGMYDFTSAEILGAFKNDLGGSKKLQMVLDDPAPSPTRDQTDWVTVQDLKNTLADRANIAWALTRSDPFVQQYSFPYAYHIKVIVRDDKALWLSSGNLNRSNEPDPKEPPSTEDRDWHVIIEDPGLAQTFAAYLNFDYNTAVANQVANPSAVEKAIEDARAKREHASNPVAPRKPGRTGNAAAKAPVAAKNFPSLSFSVTPLLTPDKVSPDLQDGQYLTNIMKLVEGAQQSIRIQLQYMEASKDNTSPYGKLLQAIKDKIDKDHLDVKLIVSANYAEKWGEKMKDEGVDLTDNIRTQPNVHNKGFVIDGQTVVVSSQNFSPAGVFDNRDAGVILASKEIAGYFQPIFDADWNGALPFVAHAEPGGSKNGKAGRGAAKKLAKQRAAKAPKKKATAKAKKSAAKPKKTSAAKKSKKRR
jgi:phosphatidylserine/phosphatidylglycerophosphate/cardiolipin synthase-like enzyme